MRIRLITVIALAVAGPACKDVKTYEVNLNHCTYNGGDDYCIEQNPERPLCNAGEGMCAIGNPVGCVAEVAPECHAPCGEPGDMSCVETPSGTMSSSGTTGTDTGATSSSESGSSTGPQCVDDDECVDAEAPFCSAEGSCVSCDGVSEPDMACAQLEPSTPVCDGGACVACTEDDVGACDGQTPVCGEGNVCAACSEHSQCPESACHLDGEQVGACFDAEDVVEVANAAELEMAIAAIGANEDRVLVLTGDSYAAVGVDFVADAELALIGDGSQLISGNSGGGFMQNGGGSIVYYAGVAVGGNVTGDGIACSGTSVWLDDSEVRNNAQVGLDVSGGCAAHLRRTIVRSNSGGGLILNGSFVEISQSAISTNLGSNPGIQLINGTLEATYSTFVGNFASGATPDSMQCTNASGFIRNSVVLGDGAPSISGCETGMIVWENNAVDTDGFGASNVNRGAWNSLWFSMPDSGDYHLTEAGEDVFMDIAMWQDGDPLMDIDGDAIPTEAPSFPGYDQP